MSRPTTKRPRIRARKLARIPTAAHARVACRRSTGS